MKVHLFPDFNPEDSGEGGIRRVWEAQRKHLPEYGVEFVASSEEADVVNIHALRYDTDKPVVFSNHGLYWSSHDWPDWAYKANYDIVTYMKRGNVRAVTAPSHWVSNSLARGMGLNPFTVYHGVNLEEWEPTRNDGYVLWAKNRVDSICNPDPLNRLAELNPQQPFVSTFGDADNPNIKVTGKVPFSVARNMIRHAGVYLANVEETGGITVMEAMAAGVPILAYRHGVNPELISHKESGYLVEPGNIEQLNEGLQYCLTHRDRLGKAARDTIIDHFQWFQVIGGYWRAYKHALNASSGPKVSVIITAYNLEEYLSDAIISVLEQDMNDWELIIVDDASPDNCGAIADDFASRDRRIKVIHNPTNSYLAEARNIGIRQAQGKYIIPLDADDMLAPYALRLLSDALDLNPDLHIVTGSMELIEEDGRRWVSDWPWEKPTFQHQINKKNMVPYASMYRREIWERCGGYRRRCRTAEDADFWTRVMSYGAKPAKITNKPTLIYRNRSTSMSHTEVEPDWTSWFTWSRLNYMTPYGAPSPEKDKRTYPVHKYGLPEISVIVPVGPGHEIYLQDCLDSLIAQTFLNWEVIVVNDTGQLWFDPDTGEALNPYVEGFPYANFLDLNKQQGSAAARNDGIRAAQSELLVFLDADDYAQPLMLDSLYAAYKAKGGWVYPDFYDQEGNYKEVKNWDGDLFLNKMLGPVTGIYPKQEILNIGGFDENAPGWEDWIMQLGLFNNGVCGSRIAIPLFTYRYDTGLNREEDFKNRKNLLQYIRDKYKDLYIKGEHFMGCKSCPGKGGAKVLTARRPAPQVMAKANTMVDGSDVMIEIEYVGTQLQSRTFKSKVKANRKYKVSGNPEHRRFYVYEGDVVWMTAMTDFRIVQNETPRVLNNTGEEIDLPSLVAERNPRPIVSVEDDPPAETPDKVVKEDKASTPVIDFGASFDPVETLIDNGLDQATVTILKNANLGIETVHDLHLIPKAQLLLINGVGPKRADQIKEATRAVLESA